MISVVSLGMLLLGVMLVNQRNAVAALDVQRDVHLRADYSQREDAFLRSLVQMVPERAALAMQEGSAPGSAGFSKVQWGQIFEDAIEAANAEIAQDGFVSKINSKALSANVADYDSKGNLVNSIVGYDKSAGKSGITFALPDDIKMPLALSYDSGSNLNEKYEIAAPIVSFEKGYYDSGSFSNYSMLPYPNIQFGYAKPGEDFVAKRNWWAFSVDFADDGETKHHGESSYVGSTVKHYIMSLYEIPSQLPISADAFMNLGRHGSDDVVSGGGGEWSDSIKIEGGVYGRRVQQDGGSQNYDYVATTEGAEISDLTSVGGITSNSVDRDSYNSANANIYGSSTGGGQDGVESFFPVSRSSDSGRVAFIPINAGTEFFDLYGNDSSNGVSPTAWDVYSRGAKQCNLIIDIVEAAESGGQGTPYGIRVSYTNRSGGLTSNFYLPKSHSLIGLNGYYDWSLHTKDTRFPFVVSKAYLGNEYDASTVAQSTLEIDVSLLREFCNKQGILLSDNNKIMVTYKAIPSVSPAPSDSLFDDALNNDTNIAVKISGASDLTSDFADGLSVVTHMRCFIDSDFNQKALSNGNYPAVSIFSPDVRFGAATADLMVTFEGRVNVLSTDRDAVVNPLDLRSASGKSFGSMIEADLKPATSVQQIPPIHFMNWLVVVEEVGQ